jgi:anaerobic magnesium-protoporphyrin IX monomethyl ester cyclase
MRFALINPPWSYEGSVYFGCKEPHLPLELGYGEALLRLKGHEVLLIDGQLQGLSPEGILHEARNFDPDFTVLTTAPGYLFWRCPPPELRVPMAIASGMRGRRGKLVIVGPHGSATPGTVLEKLGADAVIRGECEDILPRLGSPGWQLESSVYLRGKDVRSCLPNSTRLDLLPALHWPGEWVAAHLHHHHRFDAPLHGPGAEVEASRGCPFSCTFCAKEFYRGHYRKRRTETVLQELDHLLDQGVSYVYFVDELFLPEPELLEGLERRELRFGIQTRIDLLSMEAVESLGRAGCVSLEAGVESITDAGRERFGKRSRMSTRELVERLILSRRHIPFVQANLLKTEQDDRQQIIAWRRELIENGVWANDPVPLFPYPGTPEYRMLWGEPDAQAWERAHAHYLERFSEMCDLQESTPLPLPDLEGAPEVAHA